MRAHLDARGVDYAVDPGLVRGLDYYTRTAWEWQWPELGAQSDASREAAATTAWPSSSAGGRRPGVGFGAGVERLVLTLEETGAGPAVGRSLDALFAVLADEARPRVHALMDDVSAAGVRCDAAYGGRRLKRALELADRRGVPTVVIVGEDEWAAGEATRARYDYR